VHAQLYSETFPKIGPGDDPLTATGWDATSAGSAAMFDHTGSGVSNEAATPDGVDAGVAFNYRNSNGAQAIWTTEFAPIVPPGGGVDIIWYQVEDALIQGSTIDVHPAVLVGGQWYASARAFSTDDTTNAWQRNVLPYTTTAANWRLLTMNVGSATIGGTPGANLSGNIEGVGLVSLLTLFQIGNEAVWYDYLEISARLTPGDVNGVGGVTLADYDLIRANYRTNVASRALGDLNDDGFVDILDFREWKANFPGAFELADLPIPEPASSAIILLGAAFAAAQHRARLRRRRSAIDCRGL
jgi:hypothetical protein